MSLKSQTYRPDATPPDDAEIILPGKRKCRKMREEDALQISCIVALHKYQRAHKDKLRYIVCQPERARTLWRQQHDKRMGMQPGHPEILLFSTNPARVIMIELKASKGKMSESQLDWESWCKVFGYEHHVVRCLDEFLGILAAV